jgi:hypothetical protein
MVIPGWLEGAMTLILWICGVAMTGLLLAAWREGRDQAPDRWWSYPVQPLAEAAIDDAPMRASVRPALQTGAAILALALALDVSAEPQAWFAPLEPATASGVAASGLLDFTDGSGFSAYAPASWTMSASTADGWFV